MCFLFWYKVGVFVLYIDIFVWCEDFDDVVFCFVDDYCVIMSIDLNEERLEEWLMFIVIMCKLILVIKRDKYFMLYFLYIIVL